jgi:excinuclease ABC subunit C
LPATMNTTEELTQQVKHSPDLPGVYLFRDERGDVLYVGKAVSLRKRLANYLPAIRGKDAGRLAAKVNEMVGRAVTVEWIVTRNEAEALLLEQNLIKQHRSPFNIRLRDDKSYPYIVITAEEQFPRVMFTRKPHRRGNLYFGPFSSAAKVRETLDALGRVFPVRTCGGRQPGRRSGSPCLQFHIKRCPGPCEGAVGAAEYKAVIDQVVDFLSGREPEVVARLERAMQEAAARQDFESAAVFRDRLEALRHVLERQQVESSSLGSADIAGLAVDDWGANVQVFVTRDGRLADRRSLTFVNVAGAGAQEVFERFVAEYYGGPGVGVPAELIVPPSIRQTAAVASLMEGLRGRRVDVRQAERGDKRRLQELADRNAALALAHERLREERSRERRLGALSALEEALGLEGPPMRIEGFDISNLGEENPVASMVVFEGGVAKKSDYRKFAIRSTAGQDDVGAMHEALGRRFMRESANDRSYDPSFEAVPDLVVVDGGKGQLNAALAALRSAGLESVVTVISLAKREEEVFVPWASDPLELAADDVGVLLLRRVRDEAHRFALGFHRAKRAAQTTSSLLNQLPGVGEKRKRAILQHFGSPERFLQATREELEAVPGLPGKVAREVHAYVHKTG